MTKRDLWIQIGQEALSEVDRLSEAQGCGKLQERNEQVLAAATKDEASANTIKKLLETLPETRDWSKVRMIAISAPFGKRRRAGLSPRGSRPVRTPHPATIPRPPRVGLKRSIELFSGGGEKWWLEPEPPPKRGIKKKAFATMRVFFGTDRKPTGYKKPDKFFAGERGLPSFGVVEVSIPHDHRVGELEGPSWWKLQFRKNPTKHVLLLSLESLSRGKFIKDLGKSLLEIPSKEALLFLHGYNVSFQDACRRTAQIAYDLNFQGAPISYSWPSESKPSRYLVDETNVHWSAPHFRNFLSLLLSETRAEAVHVIAHSMGNRALIEALRTFDVSKLPVNCARLTQVIFAAPDIDAATFQRWPTNSVRKQHVSRSMHLQTTWLLECPKLCISIRELGILERILCCWTA